MKKASLALAFLLTAVLAQPALAHKEKIGGIIHFSGQIVHGTCTLNYPTATQKDMQIQHCTGVEPQVEVEVELQHKTIPVEQPSAIAASSQPVLIASAAGSTKSVPYYFISYP